MGRGSRTSDAAAQFGDLTTARGLADQVQCDRHREGSAGSVPGEFQQCQGAQTATERR
jgi:hypothetical protein